MAFTIDDDEAERLARMLAAKTGDSIAVATRHALKESLQSLSASERSRPDAASLADIRKRFAGLTVIDQRSPEQILGYDEKGLAS